MSRDERFGTRATISVLGDDFIVEEKKPIAYSTWHRSGPADISFIDIDWIEYCKECYEPLLLCELAQGLGNDNKPFYATRRLALRAGMPAAVVLYETEDGSRVGRITQFKIKMVARDVSDWKYVSPPEWAAFLKQLHREHECTINKNTPLWKQLVFGVSA